MQDTLEQYHGAHVSRVNCQAAVSEHQAQLREVIEGQSAQYEAALLEVRAPKCPYHQSTTWKKLYSCL
jgi:hypothetical protein